MVLRVYSDGEEPPTSTARPKRVAVPSAKVICADNAADQELASHRRAHNDASRAANAPSVISVAIPLNPPSTASPTSSRSHKVTVVEVDDNDNDIELTGSTHKKRLTKGVFILFCWISTD
jgi:hypothetical protein